MEQVSESGEVGGSRVGSSIPDQYTRLSWRRCSCLHSRVTNPPLPVFPFPSIARHFGLPPLKPLSTPTPFNPGPSQILTPLNLCPSQILTLSTFRPLSNSAPLMTSPSPSQSLSTSATLDSIPFELPPFLLAAFLIELPLHHQLSLSLHCCPLYLAVRITINTASINQPNICLLRIFTFYTYNLLVAASCGKQFSTVKVY